ncbi:MAG: transposase [Cuniculiplasma sp.]
MLEKIKTYESEEKLKIIAEGLSGSIQVPELCKKYGIQS